MRDPKGSATIPDVLIHAGFHKTGTSSLQTFLDINKTLLADYFQFYGKADFLGAGARARRFGQRPYPWRLWHFRQALRAFLKTVPDGQRLVLSRETFSGIMPGHRRILGPVPDYSRAAPKLAQAVVAELQIRFGPDVSIAFLYTLRGAEDWKQSVYGHLLRSIRLTDSFDVFSSNISPSALEADLDRIKSAIAPVEVHSVYLEDFSTFPGATGEKVLDIMGVPQERRRRLTPVGRVNVGHNATVLDEFLRLNQNTADATVLKNTKEAIAAKERKSNGR